MDSRALAPGRNEACEACGTTVGREPVRGVIRCRSSPRGDDRPAREGLAMNVGL